MIFRSPEISVSASAVSSAAASVDAASSAAASVDAAVSSFAAELPDEDDPHPASMPTAMVAASATLSTCFLFINNLLLRLNPLAWGQADKKMEKTNESCFL